MKNAITISLIVAAVLAAGCQENRGSANIQLGPVGPPEDVLSAYGTRDSSSPPMPAYGLAAPPVLPAPEPTVELPPPPAVEQRVIYTPTPVPAPAPVQRIHVVRRGETLWRISGIYYGTASRANVQKILQANPDLTDPDRILIGQKIIIPD